MILVILSILYSLSNIELDYVKANKNIKQYYQVPMGELIYSKYQALGPLLIWEGPFKGAWNI